MKKVFGRIQKAVVLLKNILLETLCKCNVVKMSVTFRYNGELLKANWGDDINYWFFREIMRDRLVCYDWSLLTQWFHKPYIAGIGSILTLFNMDNSIVWGSGILSSSDIVVGKPKRVLAVRGPLTRKRLMEQGIDCPDVYGDPALLLPRYYLPKVQKKFKLGVIPHYSDFSNPVLDSLRFDKDVIFIDIAHYNHWLEFIDQVCSCEAIASTSLHGLIISEAYGIPNVWIKVKGSELKDDFKFHDFFLSLGRDRDAYQIKMPIGKQELLKETAKWEKGELDLESLLDACPFRLKDNVQIAR